jgi:hypothetical protein
MLIAGQTNTNPNFSQSTQNCLQSKLSTRKLHFKVQKRQPQTTFETLKYVQDTTF